jgi:nucleotide-binding universal stress UspA family protein
MYSKVLVPLDGSEVAECVLQHVEAIANSIKGVITLLTVVEPIEMPTRGQIAITDDDLKRMHSELEKEAHGYLDSVARRFKLSGIKTRSIVQVGKPADTLIEYIHNNKVDLVIMSTHGRSGFSKLFWGSVTEKVIKTVDTPIFLVKAGTCKEGD